MLITGGMYKIKDIFYEKFNDKNLTMNRGKGRPFYFCMKDNKNPLIYWMIPMSTKVEKAEKIIKDKFHGNEKKCWNFVINDTDRRKSVFMIQDIFPVIEKYIEKKYMAGKEHYIIKNSKLLKRVLQKSKKIIKIKFSKKDFLNFSTDIVAMYKKLEEELEEEFEFIKSEV